MLSSVGNQRFRKSAWTCDARSMRNVVGLLIVLGALASTGCVPVSPAVAQPAACGDVEWGGYRGSPSCAALAQRLIRGTDRACATDADCALVHPGASCREQAAATAHVARYRSEPVACTDPAGGPCPAAVASCVEGCCVAR